MWLIEENFLEKKKFFHDFKIRVDLLQTIMMKKRKRSFHIIHFSHCPQAITIEKVRTKRKII